MKIVLGTVQFGLEYGINNKDGKPTADEVFEILSAAHEAGIDTLDTADAYGDAADLIGAYHRDHGKRFSVNTKFGRSTADTIRPQLLQSIRTLDVDRIETYFYHDFHQYISDLSLQQQLLVIKEEGHFEHIGLSVYTNEELETAIDDEGIDVIQLPFNLLDNNSQRAPLLQRAKRNNKKIQARSVFLQGLFFREVATLPSLLEPLHGHLLQLQQIATEQHILMEQLALQYVNAQETIDQIVIGVDTKEQLQRNLASLGNTLPLKVLQEIDNIHVKETSLLYPYNWK